MVERPTPDIRQLRTSLLPELIYVAALPYLIFRLANPYMPATYALLLAGIPPAIRLALGLVRQRRIDLLGTFSLLAIVIALFSGLVLKDTSLQLASGSLVTGVYGVLMLSSLLTPRPLILRLAESALVGNYPAQRERFHARLQQSAGFRSFFTFITALWGGGLLLELVVRLILVYTLTVSQFLVVSSILRYGFLGVLLLLTLLFAKIHRRRQKQALGKVAEQQTQETFHTPV
ncbi:MAG TPA: VC0807 family protein [Ktedonobacteraceae bacterium]